MWKNILIFIGGVVAGAAATYFFGKAYMDREIEEQVEDVKRVYSAKNEHEADPDDAETKEAEPNSVKTMDPSVAKQISAENIRKKDDIFHVEKLISDEKYRQNYNLFSSPMSEKNKRILAEALSNDESEDENNEGPEDWPREGLRERPYTISQEDFIEGNKYYDKTTLNYYDDGVLEDEITGELIHDIDAVIGYDSLTKFGEYEDDVVFVRNERISTDYEVVRQYRNFAPQFSEEDSD